MEKIVKKIDSVLMNFLVILMIIMVIDVSLQVITRYILKNPPSFTEELATFLMIWIGLLGGAYALRQKAHLGIDILTMKLKPEMRLKWEIFIYSMVILFSVLVMLWGGIKLVYINLKVGQVSAALQVPMGIIYLAIPITGILLCLYSVFFMTQALALLKKE